MTAATRLFLLLRKRRSSDQDPQRLTSVLAITAFGTTTALLLIVLGGVRAFLGRASRSGTIAGWMNQAGTNDFSNDSQYPLLAMIAALLLLIPLGTLGGSAARLAVARRDARLAALRLAGATTGQVTTLTILDATTQAAVGAVLGIAGYGALLPLVAQLRFQGRTFHIAELWVGVPTLLVACLAVIVIALLSALVSLRRVAITPLGVAARTTPPGLKWARILAMVGAFVATIVVTQVRFGSTGVAIGFTVAVLAIGFATINVVGPFVIWLIGRITASVAHTVPTLLAGRRIADSPKTAWRSVGGVALATFIAGLTSIFALFDADPTTNPADALLMTDLKTGGFLTLAIAGLLAAVSTGVMQSGRVIDQRNEYRALLLAGTDTKTLNAAQLRETVIPLLVAVGVATGAVLLFMGPIIGMSSFTNIAVAAQFLACVAGATAVVAAGAAASRLTVRSVTQL